MLLKRMLSCAIALLMIFSCFGFSASAFAEPKISELIESSTSGYKTVYKLTENDIRLIKNNVKTLSDEEKLLEITDCMGIKKIRGKMFERLLGQFDGMQGLISTTSYIKVDKDGNQTPMSKEACLAEVEQAKRIKVNPTKDNGLISSDSEISDNGYMEQTMLIVYNDDTALFGEYAFFGVSHWLIDPVSRLTDAISFGSSSFLWANENTNSYEFSLLYDETVTYYNQNGTVTNEVTTEVEEYTERDPEIHENGFFYTFNLPNNLPRTFDSSSSTKRSDFSAVICGTCEPKAAPVSSTAYMLVLTYVHIQFTVNAGLSFGWSSGDGFGVSISASLGTIEKNYTHYFGWRYYELFA